MNDLIKLLIENKIFPSLIISLIVAILLILSIYHYAKKIQVAQDISNLFSLFQSRNIKKLDKKVSDNNYSEYEKKNFSYKKKTLMYQKDLLTAENSLPTLIYLNSLENTKLAVSLYNNSKTLLKFNEEINSIELLNNFSSEYAKQREHIGVIVFFINGISSYFIMLILLYLFNTNFNYSKIIPIGFFVFILMLLQVYLGGVFLRYRSKHSNALQLLAMKKINLDYLKKFDS